MPERETDAHQSNRYENKRKLPSLQLIPTTNTHPKAATNMCKKFASAPICTISLMWGTSGENVEWRLQELQLSGLTALARIFPIPVSQGLVAWQNDKQPANSRSPIMTSSGYPRANVEREMRNLRGRSTPQKEVFW